MKFEYLTGFLYDKVMLYSVHLIVTVIALLIIPFAYVVIFFIYNPLLVYWPT